MEGLFLAVLLALGGYALQRRLERQRIALLGSHLGRYQIEKLMATLNEGYMRALGEGDPQRQDQVWRHLRPSEIALCEQFDAFAAGFSRVDAAQARVSKLAFSPPFIERIFPAATFDLRKALAIHARGIRQAVHDDPERAPKSRAFTLSAELFLMQHTCHWFCKSRSVASARMLVRHKTHYAQLLAGVAPGTAKAYAALLAA